MAFFSDKDDIKTPSNSMCQELSEVNYSELKNRLERSLSLMRRGYRDKILNWIRNLKIRTQWQNRVKIFERMNGNTDATSHFGASSLIFERFEIKRRIGFQMAYSFGKCNNPDCSSQCALAVARIVLSPRNLWGRHRGCFLNATWGIKYWDLASGSQSLNRSLPIGGPNDSRLLVWGASPADTSEIKDSEEDNWFNIRRLDFPVRSQSLEEGWFS